MYNGNNSAPLRIKTRRQVHNHASADTADLGLSTWFLTGDSTLVAYRLWAHGFPTASGQPGPKRVFS